jgi:hypothetical protein
VHTIIDVASLSPEEKCLLAATAANRGKMQVAMRVDAHGRVAMVGRRVFADPQSRDVAEKHLNAVSRLQDLQLLRAAGKRDHYELTNVGWEMSRRLRQM